MISSIHYEIKPPIAPYQSQPTSAGGYSPISMMHAIKNVQPTPWRIFPGLFSCNLIQAPLRTRRGENEVRLAVSEFRSNLYR